MVLEGRLWNINLWQQSGSELIFSYTWQHHVFNDNIQVSGGSRGGSGGSNEPPLEPKLFHFLGEFQEKLVKLHKSNPPQLIWTPDPKFLDPPLQVRIKYLDSNIIQKGNGTLLRCYLKDYFAADVDTSKCLYTLVKCFITNFHTVPFPKGLMGENLNAMFIEFQVLDTYHKNIHILDQDLGKTCF